MQACNLFAELCAMIGTYNILYSYDTGSLIEDIIFQTARCSSVVLRDFIKYKQC